MRLVQRLCDKIRKNADKIIRVEEQMLEDAEIVVFAYGIVARAALSAVRKARQQGIKAGLLRPITLWPFPEKHVTKAAEKARAIIVPEMNCGQMVREVERAAKGTSVFHMPKLGEEPHTPMEILEFIRRHGK
jgi:2-oxoglutarate ferredoxin oxidoreductase subunit alpha